MSYGFPKFSKEEIAWFLWIVSILGWAFWTLVFWLISFIDISIGLK